MFPVSSHYFAGVPTYNDARDAYGLSRATSFADVTDDTNVQTMLEDAYGGDIGLLDALTGALAEGSNMSSDAVLGDLLQVSKELQTRETSHGRGAETRSKARDTRRYVSIGAQSR